MDKSWMKLPRVERRYFKGIEAFIDFVRIKKSNSSFHPCPCKVCNLTGRWLVLDEMRKHLINDGMMDSYKVWTMHGEVACEQIDEDLETNDVQMVGGSNDMTVEMLGAVFPLRDLRNIVDDDTIEHDYVQNNLAFEKYCSLLNEARKPIYRGSDKVVLTTILKGMKAKVEGRWSDKSYDEHLEMMQDVMPLDNNVPKTYQEVKKVLKSFGLGYETFHACLYGCVLYYKEYEHHESCPVCEEPRYVMREGKSKVPKRTVRYFPITPRLQRLYTSAHVAKEMRWHAERLATDDEEVLRHPVDGDAWKKFDAQFPDFAREIRNVRLGLATDGFNPFGMTASTPYTIWPVMVMPYNLPPSMCMQKEFNILALLISGPKSPGKCLNVLMRPLIDELQMLWSEGAATYDRHTRCCFTMRVAVLWTISDFPGLGMLGGVQTKGYKACPLCLDEIDAVNSDRRTTYQGHRRWLPRDHPWRAGDKYGGCAEYRDMPTSLSGCEILEVIDSHMRDFKVLSLNKQLKGQGKPKQLCWTHKSIFYELPYWKYLNQPYSLDVMHIEKNVFDCVVGAVLSLEGKRHLWDIESGRPSYTVSPEHKVTILEMLRDVEYPSGYAGSLKSKINLQERKFVGLKTHDCHVMLERLIPVFIRPYLPAFVVNPLVCLCLWFQRLCCRELRRGDVIQLKEDIVLILCHFERIFPPTFFTIMVHLMVHLPDQVLLKGPVHFSWMYPIERQLGEYKKFVRNTRYPEGCISSQYIVQETVTYVNLYLATNSAQAVEGFGNKDGSVTLSGYIPNKQLNSKQLRIAHWCVLENFERTRNFIDYHRVTFEEKYPNHNEDDRIKHCILYFKRWMESLEGSDDFDEYLYGLSCKPHAHHFYSQCVVNGVKFVTWERDCRSSTTQNSGVMVETDDEKYYGILEDIIEMIYPRGASIIVFKCRWFNENRLSVKRDHGLHSVDTSQSWYEDTPYCLASLAKQVFYVDDPKLGENWKVVGIVSQRGIFNAKSIAREDESMDNAYQEVATMDIQQVPIDSLYIDLELLPRAPRVNIENEFEEDDEDDVSEDDQDDTSDFDHEARQVEDDDDDDFRGL